MTTYFARNLRATVLVMLVIVASGLGALQVLGRQEDPTLIERFAIVETRFPGASAERVEALVSKPLETAILELAEVREVISVSRANVSILTVELREDLSATQVDQAWTLVREQVDAGRASLPAGVGASDVQRQYIGAVTMLVALSWDDAREESLGIVVRLARDLADRFQSMEGTEETDLFGEVNEEVRVLVDPDRLAGLGLTAADVAGALQRADAKAPAGQVRGEGVNLGVEIAGELVGVDRIGVVPVVQTPTGETVRIADLARIEKGVETPQPVQALWNEERVVYVGAYLQPGLRVDRWTERARAVVADFAAESPQGVSVDIVFEQDTYVEQRLSGLAINFLQAAGIVFLVLFVLMGLRAALIVGSALPATVLVVLTVFNVTGEPLHQMSVTGLVIALGMLIDTAIVVMDEYHQKRMKGLAPLAAVDATVRLLFAPLVASTLTTVFAFAPIALMAGSAGEFVGYIGWSVIFAVLASLGLGLTIVPALAARFDGGAHAQGPWWAFWRDGLRLPMLTGAFRASVRFTARAPLFGVLIGFAMPAAGFYAASTLPMQFFPPTDRDTFQLDLVLPATTAIGETRATVEAVSAVVRDHDGVLDIGWVIGEAAPRTYYNVFGARGGQPNAAAGWVRTTGPDATRAIVGPLQERLRAEFPAARILALPFEQGPPTPAPIEFKVIGPDVDVLDALAQDLRGLLAQSANVTYTAAGLALGAPVARLDADEAAARYVGASLTDLAGLVRADLDGVVGGSVLEGTEELPVRVILDGPARGGLDAVRAKSLPQPGATFGTPLSALGDLALEPQVAAIGRLQGERFNQVLGFVTPFTLPSVARADFDARFAASGLTPPPGYRIEIGGEAEASGEAMANLGAAAGPLLVLIVACLVLAFNHFGYAGIIGLVGVQSVGLAFLGVWAFGQPLGFNAIVGAMGLVGLAINGAIVVLSLLKDDPRTATGDPDAIGDVTVEASRHIAATTLTTIGGFTPLILSGDSFWLPLSAAIAGGTAGSAILALYFAPAAFALMTAGKRRKAQRAARQAAA